MSAVLAAVADPRVTIGVDRIVRINDLRIDDPEVHALVSASSDPDATVTRMLTVGARALAVAQVSVDMNAVETSFAHLTQALSQQLDQAHGRVVGAATDLLTDPDRGLTARLQAWRRDVDKSLDATFNPDLATSAFGRLDKVLERASVEQLRATQRLLSPEVDDSPAARLLASVREQVNTVVDAMTRLGEQVSTERAASKAERAALERSAVKGQDYEELVAQTVTNLAASSGDVAEAVGRTSGSSGTRIGDIVVDVDPSLSGGASARYVLECKDRRLSLKALLAELRGAATNRDAQAAVAVISRAAHAPVAEPFAVFDNLAIVTFDKDEPDPAALRLALAWARWVVLRNSPVAVESIDTAAVGAAVEQARQALGRRTAIRRAHSAAVRRIQEAGGEVDEMHDELASLLTRIEQALR